MPWTLALSASLHWTLLSSFLLISSLPFIIVELLGGLPCLLDSFLPRPPCRFAAWVDSQAHSLSRRNIRTCLVLCRGGIPVSHEINAMSKGKIQLGGEMCSAARVGRQPAQTPFFLFELDDERVIRWSCRNWPLGIPGVQKRAFLPYIFPLQAKGYPKL